MGKKLEQDTVKEDSVRLSFILRGANRIKIFNALANGTKTPTGIKNHTGIDLSSVCRTLREFRKRIIITCQNPEKSHGKLYELSPDVKKFIDQIRISA